MTKHWIVGSWRDRLAYAELFPLLREYNTPKTLKRRPILLPADKGHHDHVSIAGA